MPEVDWPYEGLSIDERIVYTIGSAIIFLFGQLPIFGLNGEASKQIIDPFYFQRPLFAMEKGTLLELGLLPVLTSAFVWQVAASLRLVNVNFYVRSDRELFQSAQKLTAITLSMLYAAGLVFSPYYSNALLTSNTFFSDSWSLLQYVLISAQITTMSYVVIMLVEILDKGYGFGSGALTLLSVQGAMSLVRDMVGVEHVFLPNSNKGGNVGVLLNFFRGLDFNFQHWKTNVIETFTRTGLPNLTQVYIMLAVVLVIIYLQSVRLDVPIRSTRVRGMSNFYPIRLLYTGGLPVLFAYTILANVHLFGFVIASSLQSYTPVLSRVIGTWSLDYKNNHYNLVSGILYYLSPPTSLTQALTSPIKDIFFLAVVLSLALSFAYTWSFSSGSSPKDIAASFKEQAISISGRRDISVAKEFSKTVPLAALLGALVLSVIAYFSDFVGGLGKGVSMVVSICSAFALIEDFTLEYRQSGGASQLANVISSQVKS